MELSGMRNESTKMTRYVKTEQAKRSFSRGSYFGNRRIKKANIVQRMTLSQFPRIDKTIVKSRYMNFETNMLSKSKCDLPHLKNRKKIHKLLSRMDVIYKNYNNDILPIRKNKSVILKNHLSTNNLHKKWESEIKVNINKKYNDEEILEMIANNDSSYFRDKPLSMKKMLILGSMQSTFLCSNFCRFQPLLNVFE